MGFQYSNRKLLGDPRSGTRMCFICTSQGWDPVPDSRFLGSPRSGGMAGSENSPKSRAALVWIIISCFSLRWSSHYYLC